MSNDEINVLKELRKIPIFKMSLGSKELFHSNFLEFLWDEDNVAFAKMINEIYGKSVLEPNVEYKLSREKQNFDLCIYHEIKYGRNGKELVNPRVIYDLIIENKVKSIPDIEQLEGYEQTAGKGANFLLLSLVENFEHIEEISKKWNVINYKTLSEKIKGTYNLTNNYIKDYCEFIDNLHTLQSCIVPDNTIFLQQKLYPLYDDYKRYRLHDLYIKRRGLKFIELLKEKLCNKIYYEVIKLGGDNLRELYKKDNKTTPIVYLNWNVYNAEGQIAAFIYDGKEAIYEIVIQGSKVNQYRHGINYKSYDGGTYQSMDMDATESKNKIWGIVKDFDFMDGFKYPDQDKNKNYCGYYSDYIYRYKKVEELPEIDNIGKLLDIMVADIEKTYQKVCNGSKM